MSFSESVVTFGLPLSVPSWAARANPQMTRASSEENVRFMAFSRYGCFRGRLGSLALAFLHADVAQRQRQAVVLEADVALAGDLHPVPRAGRFGGILRRRDAGNDRRSRLVDLVQRRSTPLTLTIVPRRPPGVPTRSAECPSAVRLHGRRRCRGCFRGG